MRRSAGVELSMFDEIHRLMKLNKYGDIRRKLYSKKDDRLKAPFKRHANHSWYLLGESFFKQGKMIEALAAFRKSFRSDKDDADALMAIGNCLSELSKPRQAELAFRKALALHHEGRAGALSYNLGNALFDQRKYKEAISFYRRVPYKQKTLFKRTCKNLKLSKGRLLATNQIKKKRN